MSGANRDGVAVAGLVNVDGVPFAGGPVVPVNPVLCLDTTIASVTASGSTTTSVTRATGTNRYFLLFIFFETTASVPASLLANWGGQPGTLLASENATSGNWNVIEVYGFLESEIAAMTSNTVSLINMAGRTLVGSVQCENVVQVTPTNVAANAVYGASSLGSPLAGVTLTADNLSMVVGGHGWGATPTSFSFLGTNAPNQNIQQLVGNSLIGGVGTRSVVVDGSTVDVRGAPSTSSSNVATNAAIELRPAA